MRMPKKRRAPRKSELISIPSGARLLTMSLDLGAAMVFATAYLIGRWW